MKWMTFTLAVGLWCGSGCAWLRPPEPTGFAGTDVDSSNGLGDYMQAQGRAPGSNVGVPGGDVPRRGGR